MTALAEAVAAELEEEATLEQIQLLESDLHAWRLELLAYRERTVAEVQAVRQAILRANADIDNGAQRRRVLARLEEDRARWTQQVARIEQRVGRLNRVMRDLLGHRMSEQLGGDVLDRRLVEILVERAIAWRNQQGEHVHPSDASMAEAVDALLAYRRVSA